MSHHIQKIDSQRITIRPFNGMSPRIHPTVFIADGARVIGDVTIEENSSLWYNVVNRGDVGPITIATGTNIQDLAMCHLDSSGAANYRAYIEGYRAED